MNLKSFLIYTYTLVAVEPIVVSFAAEIEFSKTLLNKKFVNIQPLESPMEELFCDGVVGGQEGPTREVCELQGSGAWSDKSEYGHERTQKQLTRHTRSHG